MDPEKISKIVNMPAPKTKGEVSTFLGICSYLAALIAHYAELPMSLTQLTHQNVGYSWTADCQQSFDLLKKIIVSDPVLIMPDPNKPFIIACDASDHSGLAVLIQADDDGLRHPVAY